MVELTDAQQKIRTSLITAISNDNLQTVQEIFNNHEGNDIQAVLSHKGYLNSHKDTILDFAIFCLKREIEAQGEIGKSVEIIEQIWQEADQKTRDSVCYRAMDSFKSYPNEINSSNIEIYPDLKEVIEKVEEHKRVMGLDSDLQKAIKSLNVNQVKTALENCGEDVESVLEREVYRNNGAVDSLLVFPLKVKYKELNQEDVKKIKEITKLLWDKASPDVRNFWLEDYIVNREGQNTGDNYIIDSLEKQQKKYANIAGKRWLEDLIKEVKDYRRQMDIERNDSILEEEDKQALELAKQESLLTAPIATNTTEPTTGNQTPGNNGTSLPDNKKNTVGATATPVNSSNTPPAPTTDSKTPEKNNTTFWSEHKGKIALGAAVVCTAGAVAAYVLAYPAVALALTVLAAVILMGAGIAKVLEDPSVEKPFTQQQKA